jgi:hypothetical protein
VNIKPSSITHIIGFPYHTNSKSNNNNDDDNEEIETELDTSIFKPLYELSNKYLQNGYSILYTAERLPHETYKSKIVENIQNVHTDNIDEVQNNISKGLLTVINSDTIYKESTSGTNIVDF